MLVAAVQPELAHSQTPVATDSAIVDSAAVADTTKPRRLIPVQVRADRRTRYGSTQTRTATKTATPLRDVPQAITVVSRELMRDVSAQGMADIARLIPGLTMGQGEGNRDQPTIRGNSTTADFFVDGIRDDVQYVRDLDNAERVEALKGSNAMIFGRGGGGGVLNRVSKEADGTHVRDVTLDGGSFDHKRATVDVGEGFTPSFAGRFNGMIERSGMFRDGVTIERHGINPTFTVAPGSRTRVVIGYERFADRRTADRGIPSFEGRPVETDVSTFFGDPASSWAEVSADAAMVTVALEAGRGIGVQNRTRYARYDKFYQNVYPGAVNAAGDEVSISAYNNGTQRQNLFNQTDLTFGARTGPIEHLFLAGAEIGRQITDNARLTGYFNGTTTTVNAPVSDPTISVPLEFRQSATDADNHITAIAQSVYAQDQVRLSEHVQLIAGLRFERFDVTHRDNRTRNELRRADRMVSPRLGVLFKPVDRVSFYASRSVSHLPSSGDQFSGLTDVARTLEPERFTNLEAGAKWDVGDRMALTTALYRLDHTNTRAPHPTDPARTLQTGSQRATGFELGVSGNLTPAWEIAWGYANQRAFITSTTTAAPAGAMVPLVPRATVSLWNRYQVVRTVGVGLGITNRSDMFAALDNKVTIPAFTEFCGALYLRLGRNLRAQAYLENMLGTRYYSTAHNNNNISPGSRRAIRVSLTTGI